MTKPPFRPPTEVLIKDYSGLIESTSEIIGSMRVTQSSLEYPEKRLYKALIDFLEHTRNELKKIPPEGVYYRKG